MSTHDLIIRNGSVVDGTGTEPTRADVAVDGDRITRIGDLAEATAATEIDATGKLVTPASSTCTPISTPRWAGTPSCDRARTTA